MKTLAVAAALALALGGVSSACASAVAVPAATVPAASSSSVAPASGNAGAAPLASAAAKVATTKLLVVVLENHSEIHALDGMPKLAAVAHRFGYASDYRAIAHPSLPNYLSMIGGSSFGVADDADPSSHPVAGKSVLDQALATGHTAKVYAESMPSNCTTTPAAPYAVKHNAWAYFSSAGSRADCKRYDVPAGSLAKGALHADVRAGHLPNVGLLIPNLCDDAHDCPLSSADAFLAGWLPQLESGPDWKSGRLAIAVTFDEDDYSGPNRVLTVVIAPSVKHKVVSSRLSHFSLTRWMDDLVAAPPLRKAAGAPSLGKAFGL